MTSFLRSSRFLLLSVAASPFIVGCTSTQQRTGTVAAGSAAAAGVAYGLSKDHKDSALAVGAAAVGGAAVTSMMLGPDGQVYQQGYRDGYELGQAEAVKRQYWMQQNMQKWGGGANSPKTYYYTLPGPETRVDGAKLEPTEITVPILEQR